MKQEKEVSLLPAHSSGGIEMKLLPKLSKGMERKYYRCSGCKKVQAHDFIPYGLGTQDIQYNSCLCQLTGHNAHLLEEITPEEFYEKFGDLK